MQYGTFLDSIRLLIQIQSVHKVRNYFVDNGVFFNK